MIWQRRWTAAWSFPIYRWPPSQVDTPEITQELMARALPPNVRALGSEQYSCTVVKPLPINLLCAIFVGRTSTGETQFGGGDASVGSRFWPPPWSLQQAS